MNPQYTNIFFFTSYLRIFSYETLTGLKYRQPIPKHRVLKTYEIY